MRAGIRRSTKMKFTIKVINSEKQFRIKIYQNKKLIHSCGWHGGEFEYQGVWYMILGPYHGLTGDKFRVYKLEPVSEIV